ncbi:MAG: malonyl CoA-acyl carrier protein transacylase, partial [Pseudomonadota bacterium]|nr:malonyl CoA-acyl carrier protein transacylase [Pseudomonadota bacterium]
VAWMAGQGVDAIWEVGAGKALSGMVRRIERSITCTAIGTPEDVQKAVASLA